MPTLYQCNSRCSWQLGSLLVRMEFSLTHCISDLFPRFYLRLIFVSDLFKHYFHVLLRCALKHCWVKEAWLTSLHPCTAQGDTVQSRHLQAQIWLLYYTILHYTTLYSSALKPLVLITLCQFCFSFQKRHSLCMRSYRVVEKVKNN